MLLASEAPLGKLWVLGFQGFKAGSSPRVLSCVFCSVNHRDVCKFQRSSFGLIRSAGPGSRCWRAAICRHYGSGCGLFDRKRVAPESQTCRSRISQRSLSCAAAGLGAVLCICGEHMQKGSDCSWPCGCTVAAASNALSEAAYPKCWPVYEAAAGSGCQHGLAGSIHPQNHLRRRGLPPCPLNPAAGAADSTAQLLPVDVVLPPDMRFWRAPEVDLKALYPVGHSGLERALHPVGNVSYPCALAAQCATHTACSGRLDGASCTCALRHKFTVLLPVSRFEVVLRERLQQTQCAYSAVQSSGSSFRNMCSVTWHRRVACGRVPMSVYGMYLIRSRIDYM